MDAGRAPPPPRCSQSKALNRAQQIDFYSPFFLWTGLRIFHGKIVMINYSY